MATVWDNQDLLHRAEMAARAEEVNIARAGAWRAETDGQADNSEDLGLCSEIPLRDWLDLAWRVVWPVVSFTAAVVGVYLYIRWATGQIG